MTGVAAWDVVGMRGSGHQMADGLTQPCWFPPFLFRALCRTNYFSKIPVFPAIFCLLVLYTSLATFISQYFVHPL